MTCTWACVKGPSCCAEVGICISLPFTRLCATRTFMLCEGSCTHSSLPLLACALGVRPPLPSLACALRVRPPPPHSPVRS